MQKVCLRKDNGEWCWFSHRDSYNWDAEDYDVIEFPETFSVEDVEIYLKIYENAENAENKV